MKAGRLDGKAALITGSSSGIGRETARLFAAEGACVMITGRSKERCEAAVQDIRRKGGTAEYILCDLYREDAPGFLMEKMKSSFGGIDILVNNAAWWKGEAFLSVTREDFRKGFSAYLESLYFLSQAAAKQMVEEKRAGKIVHIASTAAYYGERGMSVYCAAKAAVVNLTRAMALELGKWITSMTMTVFYLLLYAVWRERYRIRGRQGLTALVGLLAGVRILLCMLPQNRWLSADAPLVWGIWRNIPFALLGLVMILLFYRRAKETGDRAFSRMWLTIALSFGFYIPVVLWADAVPMVGMLMIPKTCAYVWTVLIGYNAMKQEL